MNVFLGLCLLGILGGGDQQSVNCLKWQSQIDASVTYRGQSPIVSRLSNEERLEAIACLMALEGRVAPAKIGGVTRLDVSQILPDASIEVAALFYIRFIYYGKWDHCLGIALVDSAGEFNRTTSVKNAYSSYKQWFEKVKVIGLDEARKKGIDPMDSCPGVRWY